MITKEKEQNSEAQRRELTSMEHIANPLSHHMLTADLSTWLFATDFISVFLNNVTSMKIGLLMVLLFDN
jgi:hypothetical protein